jgi:hypothetical protein
VAAGVDHDVRIVKDEEVNYERALRVHSGQTLIVSLRSDEPQEGDKKTMENLGLATDVLLGEGGSVMATGLVMLIVGRIREKRSVITVVPSVGNGMAGLITIGAF